MKIYTFCRDVESVQIVGNYKELLPTVLKAEAGYMRVQLLFVT